MTYKHDFLVYRPLLSESVPQLQSLQNELASIDSFEPIENLHLTLLSGYTKKRLNIPTLQRVASSAPELSTNAYDTEVIGARLDKRSLDLTRVALRLILDSEGSAHYFEEHEAFKKAVNKIDDTMLIRNFAGPRVTLGYLDTTDGLASVVETAEAHIGSTLRFGPTESNVGKMHQAAETHKTTAVHASTPMTIDAPVRILKSRAIPQGFLASLRPGGPNT